LTLAGTYISSSKTQGEPGKNTRIKKFEGQRPAREALPSKHLSSASHVK
jgi:hypothetical protein